MSFILVCGGLILLAGGAEIMIRGAASLGRRAGVSPMWIGIVLVGFGTSTPELLTSLQAAMNGSPGLAVGNIVGSNIANILLILGVAALISPMPVIPQGFLRDMGALLAATFILTGMTFASVIGALAGTLFLCAFAAYIVVLYRAEREKPDAAGEVYISEGIQMTPAAGSVVRDLALFVPGLVAVLIGAGLLVRGATNAALLLGVSETVVGLTVVAVGTSLPELTTSVVAALRKQTEISFGNVVGSNIFNALAILGVTGLVAPIDVPQEVLRLDIWVMAAAAILLTVFAATGWRLSRVEAAVFLACYVAYTAVLAVPSWRSAVTLL